MLNRALCTIGRPWLVSLLTLLWLSALQAAEAPNPASDTFWYSADAQGAPVVHLYFFWTETCPHCRHARPFVASLPEDYPWLRVHSHELLASRDNVNLYRLVARAIGQRAASVPAFAFCGQMLTGYDDTDTTGAQLRDLLHECRDAARRALAGGGPLNLGAPQSVTLPFIGQMDPASLSLPAFTVVIAGLDAFNPCAFFVLLFLLSLLLHARGRARMLLIGGVFVFFSGLVYFVFMAAWLNLFLVMGQLRVITAAAGVIALLMAAINIKDWFRFRQGPSLSIPESAKAGLFRRMRQLATSGNPAAMLAGTVALAIAANGYELLCTAGFPMVYTRILTLNALDTASYYLYLLFYNLVYVVPLAVIVLLFTLTLGSRKLSEREGRLLKLVSGLMMLGLGLVLLLAPRLLNHLGVAAGLLALALAGATVLALIERLRHGRSAH